MNLLTLSLGLLAVGPASVGSTQDTPLTKSVPELSLRLTRGDLWSGELSQRFFASGVEDDGQKFAFRVEYHVAQAGRQEYSIDMAILFRESWLGDTRVPPPDDIKPMRAAVRWLRVGWRTPKSKRLDDPIEYRLERLTWFVAPQGGERKGAEPAWSARFSGKEGGSVPDARAEFRYLKAGSWRDRPAAWVAVRFTELDIDRPMLGEGEAIVDLASGVLLELSLDVKNAPVPGGDGGLSELSLAWKVESLKLSSSPEARS